MPDFEIRYYRADGTLALVHISSQNDEDGALELARENLADHARFEIRSGDGTPISQRR